MHARKAVSLRCQKFGVGLCRFTHAPQAVIASSAPPPGAPRDDALRYLDITRNAYIRFFPGHTAAVSSLVTNPQDDTFISVSLDKSLRLWDLRASARGACTAMCALPDDAASFATYDREGQIFAVAVGGRQVKLFDPRSLSVGPFETFRFPEQKRWTGISISQDGRFILLPAADGVITLVDAFTGERLRTFEGHVNESSSALDACFTPDSAFVLSGSEDGTVHVWRTADAAPVAVLQRHAGPVAALR